MTEDVRRWVEQEELIQPGDFVLAGVSGGADSVCLLLLLLQLRESMGFLLGVVHVEHGIRGAESDRDAAFVETLCADAGVACRVYHRNAPMLAEEEGIGLEEAARRLRYDCYLQEAERVGVARVKVALAHHADDLAETVLFQLARGSGVRGLGGMPVKRELAEGIWLIRPLLAVSREQIERYLQAHGQAYRTDSTNGDLEYSRNRIRHAVLPQLARVNPQVVQHICRSAAQMADLCDYLDCEVERILPAVCVQTGQEAGEEYILSGELFEQYHRAMVQRTVYRVLGLAAGSRRDIASSHVEAVIRLASSQVGRQIPLPGGLVAARIYEGVRICGGWTRDDTAQGRASHAVKITTEQMRRAERGERVTVPLPNGQICVRVEDFCGDMAEIPKKKYTKWLNYDKIKSGLCIRTRASGDYLIIDTQGHAKKLKKYFIEEKIPAECRDDIWLLAEDAHVLWVVGGRISAGYRLEPHTEKVLEVQMIGGSYCED